MANQSGPAVIQRCYPGHLLFSEQAVPRTTHESRKAVPLTEFVKQG